jgi:hypothetical protein
MILNQEVCETSECDRECTAVSFTGIETQVLKCNNFCRIVKLQKERQLGVEQSNVRHVSHDRAQPRDRAQPNDSIG